LCIRPVAAGTQEKCAAQTHREKPSQKFHSISESIICMVDKINDRGSAQPCIRPCVLTELRKNNHHGQTSAEA
jgi:hypothetical protein